MGYGSTALKDEEEKFGNLWTDDKQSHLCFRCYGRRYFSDENYYINVEGNELKASWEDLRTKRDHTNAKETEIMDHLDWKAASKMNEASRTTLTRVYEGNL